MVYCDPVHCMYLVYLFGCRLSDTNNREFLQIFLEHSFLQTFGNYL
jgi:hypothetical protein